MLKKSIFCFLGIFLGCLMALFILMIFKRSEIQRDWGHPKAWLAYFTVLTSLQVFLFFLIFRGIEKGFKFTLLSSDANLVVFCFLYSVIDILSLYFILGPILDLSYENKLINSFMENISKFSHLPMDTVIELLIYPFLIFILTAFVYNHFFISSLSKNRL